MGVLLCAVAALVVGIVVPPLFPSDTSSGSVVAAPASGQAGVVAPGSGDPDQVDGEPAVPPAALGADRVQTQPAPALVGNRTAVPPGGGSSAPTGQPAPVTEPSPLADLGQRVDRSADQTERPAQRRANTESGNSRPRTDPDPAPPPPRGGGATQADYEKVRQAILDYRSGSSGSNSGNGGGNGNGNGGGNGGGNDGGNGSGSGGSSSGGGNGGGNGGGSGGGAGGSDGSDGGAGGGSGSSDGD